MAGRGLFLLGLKAALEGQPHGSLEATATGLCTPNDPEVVALGIEGRVTRLRVIQHVRGIDTKLKLLGFRDAERLAHVRIETPGAASHDRVPAECSRPTRLGRLEDDLARST